MSSAGFEPDHAGEKRIQPFPLETTTHGKSSIDEKNISILRFNYCVNYSKIDILTSLELSVI